ncbi:hypothetical protein J6P51_02130, partial [bacterium]|nr:hypothetical protein [bacterium]
QANIQIMNTIPITIAQFKHKYSLCNACCLFPFPSSLATKYCGAIVNELNIPYKNNCNIKAIEVISL